MRKNLLLIIGLVLFFSKGNTQEISDYLYGQNAWLLPSYGGPIDNLWPKVEQAGVRLIRIGGISLDENPLTNEQYLALVDSIKAIGAEPVIQISRKATPQDATDLITYLNGTHSRDVRFWSIGNEPDWHWHNSTDPTSEWYIRDGTNGAIDIAEYFKPLASALKAYDNTIKTLGPECAWYNGAYLEGLLGGAGDITGTDGNGNYYLDVATYHAYNKTEASLVASNINSLVSLVDAANDSRPEGHKLDWGITEFNITTNNDNETEEHKVWSFYTGQYWAEVFALGMKDGAFTIAPWSIQESSGARNSGDLGFLDAAPDYNPRSTYYHEQMLSGYFNGTFLEASDNQSTVKCIANIDSSVVSVMVMNQSATNGFSFKLQLNEDDIVSDEDLKVNVPAGIDSGYVDYIQQETTLLYVFDTSGVMTNKIWYSKVLADLEEPPLNLSESDTLIVLVAIEDMSPCKDTAIEFIATVFGEPTKITWDFGEHASTTSADGIGPHMVSFDTTGTQSITFTVESENDTVEVTEEIEVLSCIQKPYNDVIQVIPGTVEAVYYDEGGEGISYHDTSEGNSGEGTENEGIRNNEDVDTEGGDVNGNIGWTEVGEWLEYTVNITETGTYKLTAHCASEPGGGAFRVLFDGITKVEEVTVPATGGWTTFTDIISYQIQLEEKDSAVMRIEVLADQFNLGQMIFELSDETSISITENMNIKVYPNPFTNALNIAGNGLDSRVSVVDIQGQVLLTDVINGNGIKELNLGNLSKGLYMVCIENQNGIKTIPVIKQ